jgi:hypothetical protein
LRKFVLVFFDDILIYSETEANHLNHLNPILKLLQQNSLFANNRVEYQGHIISSEGVSTDPSKISIVQNWPVPENITELRGFLGLAGYYRRFTKDYEKICRPLFDSLKKENSIWELIN